MRADTEHDPGDEDDGGRSDPADAIFDLLTSGFASRGQVVNLVYDPRAIHADTDIEKAVLAAVRRRPQ